MRDLPKLHVLKHAKNLGYGGNQKAGYRYFIEKGFDAVILLHGDGQYAPEILAHLYHPIVKGEADAVFGSRSGSSTVQTSWHFQQRVWKRQACGGRVGLGTSPPRICRLL